MHKKYPIGFVNEVKAEYPNFPELHTALDNGHESVGRYLNDNSSDVIKTTEVTKMIRLGQIQELRDKAEQLIRRRKLYYDWACIATELFTLKGRLL